MELYKVGKQYNMFRGQEGMVFGAGGGLTLIIKIDNPTVQETEQFKTDQKIQFGICVQQGIMFFLAKFGNLEWFDAPYHPNIGNKLEDDSIGNLLQVFLANSVNGELLYMRQLGLNTMFADKLKQEILSLNRYPIGYNQYSIAVNEVFNRYSTRDLVKMAVTTRFK